MSFYPPKINEKIKCAQNVGAPPEANVVGTSASFACGTFIRFFLLIEKDDKEIIEAKFKTSGCGFLIAAAEVLCNEIRGTKLVGLHGSDKQYFEKKIESELDKFPAERAHCLDVCLESLQAAFAAFRSAQVAEWSGEKTLICTCFAVSEETIEHLIEKESLETVDDVTDRCGAGGGCGSCQSLIQEILDGRAAVPGW